MVKAGGPTDAVIDELAELVEPDDIIIDGGNAKFEDTRRRQAALQEKGIHFVGCGVSGGEEGALNGPSIMPGGSAKSYESLGPDPGEDLRARRRRAVLHAHRHRRRRALRQDGAQRHRVRRHAADRRGLRPAAPRRRADARPRSAETFGEWNKGDLDSFLIEITAEVLAQVDASTGKPLVDVILDAAGMKGTGTWTVQTALDLGIPVSGIAEAVFARGLSSSLDAAGRGRRQAARAEQRVGGQGSGRRSSRTSGSRCTRRRSSPTRRAWTRSSPARPSTAGTSMSVRWPGSGAAAASSGRSS